MSVSALLSITGAVGIGLFWLVRLVAVEVARRDRAILGPDSYASPPPDAPMVSVVVAAKDEEQDIERCLRMILAQDYPDFEVIVVDDRSQDRTPAILDALRTEFEDRLRVITVSSLPEGWSGKNHAMHLGVSAACGEWLFFTDADCRHHSPRVISIAMAEAVAHDVDFLSVTPSLDTPELWEKVIQPVCVMALMLWFLPYRVNNPAQKTAYANGALMLMRRRCYDAIGGHTAVRMEMNEDVRMAWLAKRMGMDLRVVESDNLYITRMYDSFKSGWSGWSRILSGCLRTSQRLWITAALLLLLTIIPWIIAIGTLTYSLLTRTAAESSWPFVASVWLGAIAIHQVVEWRVYRMLRLHPIWSLTYVFGAIVTLGVLYSAIRKTKGLSKVTWRGTEYRSGQPHLRDASQSDPAPVAPSTESA